MILIDETPLEPAVIFAETADRFPGVVDFDWDAVAHELMEPWLLGGETALRAQMRVLSGRPDVTAWTAGDGKRLAATLNETVSVHWTLLGLGDEAEIPPPAVEVEAFAEASPAVSAEGDEAPSHL